MNGVGWAKVMATALDRHADAPTLDQVCAITVELFPQDWTGAMLQSLPLYAGRELREGMKQVAFLRDAARERGLDPSLSVAQIRATFSKTLYRRYHYPNTVIPDDLPRTRFPV